MILRTIRQAPAPLDAHAVDGSNNGLLRLVLELADNLLMGLTLDQRKYVAAPFTTIKIENVRGIKTWSIG